MPLWTDLRAAVRALVRDRAYSSIALLAVASLACYVPARRATLNDPIRALRCDG